MDSRWTGRLRPRAAPGLFLSYRRSDSQTATGRIDDRLRAEFGADRVFKDVDSIPAGTDFRASVAEAIGRADVVLVVIGKDWLDARDGAGGRRLDDPGDFVRVEVEAALKQGVRIIPLLLDDTAMPTAEQLPEAIRDLAYRNARRIRNDPDFHKDVDRLIRAIRHPGGPGRDGPTIPAKVAWAVAILAVVLPGAAYLACPGGTPEPAPSPDPCDRPVDLGRLQADLRARFEMPDGVPPGGLADAKVAEARLRRAVFLSLPTANNDLVAMGEALQILEREGYFKGRSDPHLGSVLELLPDLRAARFAWLEQAFRAGPGAPADVAPEIPPDVAWDPALEPYRVRLDAEAARAELACLRRLLGGPDAARAPQGDAQP